MDIGTAKPNWEEQMGIPHHMISVAEPWEDYSVSRYVEDAARCADDILNRGKTPVIVGGTGLYIDSLIRGRIFSDKPDPALRAGIEAEYNNSGGEEMLIKLAKFDAESAEKLHANDRKRIVRAFEVFHATGRTISQHNHETKALPPRYDAVKIALNFSDRQDLYNRIDDRVDSMISAGLEREVRALIEAGVPVGVTAMQAIGYKEFMGAIEGKYSVDEAVDMIKMESRRYAKRQLTWLRRDENIRWIFYEKTPDLDLGLLISTGYLQDNDYNNDRQ
jgi:tRNA dimethylallyltransferase